MILSNVTKNQVKPGICMLVPLNYLFKLEPHFFLKPDKLLFKKTTEL